MDITIFKIFLPILLIIHLISRLVLHKHFNNYTIIHIKTKRLYNILRFYSKTENRPGNKAFSFLCSINKKAFIPKNRDKSLCFAYPYIIYYPLIRNPISFSRSSGSYVIISISEMVKSPKILENETY